MRDHLLGWPAALNCIPLETRKAHVTPPREVRRDVSFEKNTSVQLPDGTWTFITEADCRQINGAAERRPCGPQNTARDEKPAAPPSTTDKPQGVWVKTSERKPPAAGWYKVTIINIFNALWWDCENWWHGNGNGTATQPAIWAEAEDWQWFDTTPSKQEDDGWLAWNGGEPPVPRDTECCVRLRYGWESGPSMLEAASWLHRWGNGDIIAYRIVKDQA